jgi:hypothetical protein
MTQPPVSSAGAPPVRDHPDAAIVLVARRGGEVLQAAVRGLIVAARTYGVDVLVLLPTSLGHSVTEAGLAIRVREISVDPAEPEAVWRARALAETAADVVEFVGDEAAAGIAWDDRLPFRLGLLRNDLDRPERLLTALEQAGVPLPHPGAT